jgi:hypothetical protein
VRSHGPALHRSGEACSRAGNEHGDRAAVGAVLRSKQAKWGYNLPHCKKSKMELVERQTHNLAEFEVNEVSCTRSNSFLLKVLRTGRLLNS